MDYVSLSYRKDLRLNRKTRNKFRATMFKKQKEISRKGTERVRDKNLKRARAKKEARRNWLGISTSEESSSKVDNPAYALEQHNIRPESDIKGDMKEGSAPISRQNIQEVAPNKENKNTGSQGESLDVGEAIVAPLNKFFERPISIFDATWTVGQDVDVAFNPWVEWSNDPTVRNKLSNYAFFRGDLTLRISVSGTPFHYGRLMISYQPWADINDVIYSYDQLMASTTPGNLANTAFLSYLSQAPGIVYVDIKENQPIEVKLPFLFPKTMAKLFNYGAGAITNANPFDDFIHMANIYIKSLNPIAVANEDFDSHVSINVYAFCTDIKLGTITGTDITITPEAKRRNRSKKIERKLENIQEEAEEAEDIVEDNASDDGWYETKTKGKPIYDKNLSWGERISQTIEKAGTHDEYSEPGPVSSIATAVSNAGTALKDVPYIGGFAKATSSVAKGIGKVASWFGFSKPLVLEKPVLGKFYPYTNGANLAGTDTAYKISADPKQELALRMDLGGDGEDCLAIKHISSRESYLATTIWSHTDVALDDTLYRMCVTPNMMNVLSLPSGKLIQPTAMAFAAQPFTYWRGNVTFRFEFVCSKFHRGKAIIRYEPNAQQAAILTANSAQLNQNNTVIIDLQETQNVELTVGWTHDRAFCSFGGASSDVYIPRHGTNLDVTQFGVEENIGWIDIRPFNELVQPTDLATVPINIYVRCDDLELAVPNQNSIANNERNVNFTESNVKTLGGGKNDSSVTKMILNQVQPSKSDMYLDHFGEKIESFRSLLRRYTAMGIYSDTMTGSDMNITSVYQGLYPSSYYPYAWNSPNVYADPNGFNHLYDYLRYGFMGQRGGYRYRFKLVGDLIVNNQDISWSNLTHDITGEVVPSAINTSYSGLASSPFYQNTLTGSVNNSIAVNGGQEVEIPYYSLNLFDFSFNSARGYDVLGGTTMSEWQNAVETFFPFFGSTATDVYVKVDSAPAEDFTFLRFQGAPCFTMDV